MIGLYRVESFGRGIYIRAPARRQSPLKARMVPFGRTGGVARHRADYTIDDADAIVEWLRDRRAGYMIPARLAHLVRS